MLNRLNSLETNIHNLEEQLSGFEKALTLSPLEEKTRIRQRIDYIKKDIRDFQQQYFQLMADRIDILAFDECELDNELSTLNTEIEKLQSKEISNDFRKKLLSTKSKIKQIGSSTEAKVKFIITTIPPFIGLAHEAEIDTRRLWTVIRNIAKKVPKK